MPSIRLLGMFCILDLGLEIIGMNVLVYVLPRKQRRKKERVVAFKDSGFHSVWALAFTLKIHGEGINVCLNIPL